MQIYTAIMEYSMNVPQKTKNRITIWSSNSIPEYIFKENERLIQKDTCTPIFISELFTTAKTLKKPKHPSTDEWINKLWYTHILEYYPIIRKEGNPAICQNMDEPTGIMFSEISQDRERQILQLLLICEKKQINNRNRLRTNQCHQ